MRPETSGCLSVSGLLQTERDALHVASDSLNQEHGVLGLVGREASIPMIPSNDCNDLSTGAGDSLNLVLFFASVTALACRLFSDRFIQLLVCFVLKLQTQFSVKLARRFWVQEGPREHHIMTACMFITEAIAMRHGPQILLWLAGAMLVALIIVIVKFGLTMTLNCDRRMGFPDF